MMEQCYELKIGTYEAQAIFLFYMIIKLIQEDGYIDEFNVREIINQHPLNTKNIIHKQILRDGCLTIEQIIQSAKAFFLQDVSNYV